MNELKVGMFVRTREQGIRKIETVFEKATINRYGYEDIKNSDYYGTAYHIIKTTDITKSSHDIIDLIEVGDYVNGWMVSSIQPDGMRLLGCEDGIEYDFEIETILTKEQYNANCYNVETN